MAKEGMGALPLAKAMGRPNLQSQIYRFSKGEVLSPARATAVPLAAYFKIPTDALYDDRGATAVALERALSAPPNLAPRSKLHPPAAEESEVEYAGHPAVTRRVPVIGEARMGPDGYYDESPSESDGSIDGYSSDPDAYALRLKGDSMHPAIRNGSFAVIEPNGRCTPGEYVALHLVNGRKMVKELIIERPDEIVIESVNGNSRQTIARIDIRTMHPVAAIVAASKWRPA